MFLFITKAGSAFGDVSHSVDLKILRRYCLSYSSTGQDSKFHTGLSTSFKVNNTEIQ